jgi:hypothetical protein
LTVPNHGPNCEQVKCHPMRCSNCGRKVHYWSCTCGSIVFFDQLGPDWPKHDCSSTGGPIVCPTCGSIIHKSDLSAPDGDTREATTRWKAIVSCILVPALKGINAKGISHVPAEALDEPIQPSRGPDGNVLFGRNGRPLFEIHPDLNRIAALWHCEILEWVKRNPESIPCPKCIGRRRNRSDTKQRVVVGTRVTLRDQDSGEQVVYTLVNVGEAEAASGKISTEAPIGRALLGRATHDEVVIRVPRGTLHYLIESVGS